VPPTNKRFALLLLLLLALAVTTAILAPGWIRKAKLKSTCQAMLVDAEMGQISALKSYIEASQHAAFDQLAKDHIPAGYDQYIEGLELSSSEFEGDGEAWVLVTAHFSAGEFGTGIALGRLHWNWDSAAKSWRWDFMGSQGADFPTSGEAQWRPLGTSSPPGPASDPGWP
jgi:hypothetical protein